MILFAIILIIIISISIVRVCQIFFTMYFYYDYSIWFDKEDKSYIESYSNIKSNFNIVVCKMSWGMEKIEELSAMKGYPSIFTKKININNSALQEYIKENSNPGEVVIKCSIPYILICIVSIIIFHRILLPKFTEEQE